MPRAQARWCEPALCAGFRPCLDTNMRHLGACPLEGDAMSAPYKIGSEYILTSDGLAWTVVGVVQLPGYDGGYLVIGERSASGLIGWQAPQGDGLENVSTFDSLRVAYAELSHRMCMAAVMG